MRTKVAWTLSVAGVLLSAHALCVTAAVAQDVRSVMGGGNFTNGYSLNQNGQCVSACANQQAQFAVLSTIRAGMARINIYPARYYSNNEPTPEVLDMVILDAHEHGVTPMILFEYYGRYASDTPPIPMLPATEWERVGQAFAERFRPNSAWLVGQGIVNWGVKVYSAFNEPDVESDATKRIPLTAYHDALAALAAGVHAADPSLKVIPGGFSRQNSHDDFTVRGYAPAISDLLNQHILDGIDLHTYFDEQFVPIQSYANSAQHTFDAVKSASGITADINFYTTEFNQHRATPAQGETVEQVEQRAAVAFLTAIWDALGVVKNDGVTRARQFAFPWSIFGSMDNDPQNGMNLNTIPAWSPTARGNVLILVLGKTQGLTFQSLDPKGTGEYVLTGGGKKMWVWQNRPGWTNHPGTSFTVTGIPANASALDVIGWDGVRDTIAIAGQTTVTVPNLAQNETYMFLAR